DAIVVADLRGEVRFVNPAALELLGGTMTEIVGTRFPLSPDDHHGHVERPDGVAVDLDVRWTQLMWEGNSAWGAFIIQQAAGQRQGGAPYDVDLERRAMQAEMRCEQLEDQVKQFKESPAKDKFSK